MTSNFTKQLIFRSPLLAIGVFRCSPSCEDFEDTGPSLSYSVAFPRVPVEITQFGRNPVVADPNVAMMYNKGQEYRRRALCSAGDRCEWFGFERTTIEHAVRLKGKHDLESDGLFFASHSVVDPADYLLQRLVYRYVTKTPSDHIDQLLVEETALRLLENVVAQSRCATSPNRGKPKRAAHLIHEIRQLLSTRFKESIHLTELASAFDISPFHLCRRFRKETGRSIHQHITHLRLRTALERLEEGCLDLTRLALDLGYSSHSHFSSVFRKAFNLTPSEARDSDFSGLKNRISNILTAEP